MIVVIFVFAFSSCCICALLLYLHFIIVSVPVYNVLALCIMFSGSTLVQDVPFGATQSSLTNQINNNNHEPR